MDILILRESDASITKELEKAHLPELVARKAKEIWISLSRLGVCRVGKRDGVIAMCVYEAYRSLKITITPDEVWEAVTGERSADVNKPLHAAYKLCTTTCRYRPVQWKQTPAQFIEHFFPYTGLTTAALEVFIEYAKKVFEVKPELEDEHPHKVAVAIILHYVYVKSCKLSPQFTEKVGNPKRYDKLFEEISKCYTKIS